MLACSQAQLSWGLQRLVHTQHCMADAKHCLTGKLKANLLLPHFLTDGSKHCCSTVSLTSMLKILSQVARLLVCKKGRPQPSSAWCQVAVLRCPGQLCPQSDCSEELQLLQGCWSPRTAESIWGKSGPVPGRVSLLRASPALKRIQ